VPVVQSPATSNERAVQSICSARVLPSRGGGFRLSQPVLRYGKTDRFRQPRARGEPVRNQWCHIPPNIARMNQSCHTISPQANSSARSPVTGHLQQTCPPIHLQRARPSSPWRGLSIYSARQLKDLRFCSMPQVRHYRARENPLNFEGLPLRVSGSPLSRRSRIRSNFQFCRSR